MTELTQEDVRDEILSLYEEKEDVLQNFSLEIEKIENEGVEFFERQVIAIKNKLVQDESVDDEKLEAAYLEEVELARKESLRLVEEKIADLVTKAETN